jgi:hypothetical protein
MLFCSRGRIEGSKDQYSTGKQGEFFEEFHFVSSRTLQQTGRGN